MISAINKDNFIFNSKEYRKDIPAFSIVESVRSTDKEMLSDEESFVVAMSGDGFPFWIWTSDKITEEQLLELDGYFIKNYSGCSEVLFVAKPEIADRLSNLFSKNASVTKTMHKMVAYENWCITEGRASNICRRLAIGSDLETIIDFYQSFKRDCDQPQISTEEAKDKLLPRIFSQKVFVAEMGGEIVGLAQRGREFDEFATINSVYTKPEYRGRGIAASLVEYVAKIIESEKKIPHLYADVDNPYSNKAYQNIGFTNRGRVDELHLKKI